MELATAKRVAIELLAKHELLSKGWTFQFDNSKRRLGCCKHKIKTITFSKNYQPLVDVEEFTDTMLHEIAHALVGHGHGHDLVWKRKAIEIGCNGKRLYKGEAKVQGKYMATCHKCGNVSYLHRKNRTNHSCGKCSGGKYNPEFLLTFKEIR